MKLLNKVKNIHQEACVSIILNTHRTKPDNQKDEINLKNLVKETENRLIENYDKRFVLSVMGNVNKVVASINHNLNMESLVIYANSDFTEFTRLPVKVEDRVIIDNTFATRDLIRAMHSESAYYVLVISKQQARLIEAFGDKVVEELAGEFPITSSLYTTDKAKLSTNKGQDNLTEEFFNRVDKQVLTTIKEHSLPILLATEIRNFSHYQKIADDKEFIIGYINGNRDNETAQKIISDAWEVMKVLTKDKNSSRIAELKNAVFQGKFLSDLSDIWKAIQHGKGKTLFVKQDYFQPVILEENTISIVDSSSHNEPNYIDDVIDEMIEFNMAFGGDIVFVEGDELKKFNGLALLTRY